MIDADEVAKAHTLHSLLGPGSPGGGGSDPYLAAQVKHAIEFSLTGVVGAAAPLENFAQAAFALVAEPTDPAPRGGGFFHLDLRRQSYDPLWVRAEVLRGLRELAGYERATLLVTGLREAVRGGRRYWTRRLVAMHASARTYIDHLAASRSSRNTQLRLLYV